MGKPRSFLTTIDNPYNYFTEFEKWLNFDTVSGHNCCQLVDHFAYTASALTDEDNEEEISRAIDEIIALDPTNLYCKVYEGEETPPSPST